MARREWNFKVEAVYRDRSIEDFCREDPLKAQRAGMALWRMFEAFREGRANTNTNAKKAA